MSGVMKMSKALANPNRLTDLLFGACLITIQGEEQSLHGRQDTAFVFIFCFSVLDPSSGFIPSTCEEESVGNTRFNSRSHHSRLICLHYGDGIVIVTLKESQEANVKLDCRVAGIEFVRPFPLLHRLVDESDVKINHPQGKVGFTKIRIHGQGTTNLSYRFFMLEATGRSP